MIKCANYGGLIWTDGPSMLYLIFKGINNATRIGVSNLKDDIEKTTSSKFGNNFKELLVIMLHNHH